MRVEYVPSAPSRGAALRGGALRFEAARPKARRGVFGVWGLGFGVWGLSPTLAHIHEERSHTHPLTLLLASHSLGSSSSPPLPQTPNPKPQTPNPNPPNLCLASSPLLFFRWELMNYMVRRELDSLTLPNLLSGFHICLCVCVCVWIWGFLSSLFVISFVISFFISLFIVWGLHMGRVCLLCVEVSVAVEAARCGVEAAARFEKAVESTVSRGRAESGPRAAESGREGRERSDRRGLLLPTARTTRPATRAWTLGRTARRRPPCAQAVNGMDRPSTGTKSTR